MSIMLISLDDASAHLRRDTTDDDADLTAKIEGASQAIINYLGAAATFLNSAGEVDFDSAGQPVGVPYVVQSATRILLGVLYADRDGVAFNEGQTGPRLGDMSLPKSVHFLLDGIRKPILV